MSYSNERNITVIFPAVNFATDTTRFFRLPKGMRGRLLDIELRATVLFTAVTTSAMIRLGISGQLTAFANINTIGAAGANAVRRASFDYPAAIVDTEMPMDTLFHASFVAPTGGSPAGTGDVQFELLAY